MKWISLLSGTQKSWLLPGSQESESSTTSLSEPGVQPPEHFSFGILKLRPQSALSARLRPFLSWDRRIGVPSHFILWTQEPRPPDPLPSGALVPPPRFGYPRIPALTQVVLPAEVQLLLVGHPLQVHSCARAGLPRVWGKTQVLTLSDRCKDHKQPRPYYDKTERN